MRANLLFIKERFDYFNALCFDNRLPEVKLRISSSLRTLGTLRHPRKLLPTLCPEDVTLSISNRLDMSRDEIEDTIIHEMIHLYIFWFGIKDTSVHGEKFKQIMSALNRRHKRNVTVMHRSSAEQRKTDRIRKPRIVLVSIFKSGEKGVTVCNPRYAIELYKAIKKFSMVRQIEIIVSYHASFSHYPASKTAKIYKIEASVLEEALNDAVYMEYDANRLRPRPIVN